MFRTVLVSGSTKAVAESCCAQSSKKLATNLINKPSSRRLFNQMATVNCLKDRLYCNHKLNGSYSSNNLNRIRSCQNVRNFSSSDLPSHIKVALPALSPTMEMGTVVSWEKVEGDRLSEGDLLAEIETDKATMGFETPEEGYLAKILVPAGEKDVPLGKLLCIIVENQEDIAAFKDYVPSPEDDQAVGKKSTPKQPQPQPPPAPTQQTTVQSVIPPPPPPQQQSRPSGNRIFASPLARAIAAAKGIDLSALQGTGPNSRIVANDLQNVQPSPGLSSTQTTASSFRDQEASAVRHSISRRSSLAKQTIPHYYLSAEIEVDQLVKLREQMNGMLAKENVKLTINDFVIKAAALACKQVPEANSSWQETFIRQYKDVDISLSVKTDAGMQSPIVFKANDLGVKEISQQVKSLAAKARDGQLQANETEGATFCITNLGMFQVSNFTAIIEPPNSCILAVGSIEQRVLPSHDAESKFKVSNILKVTLSCDHRTVDGAVGARWLQYFNQYMNNPFTMVL